MRRARSYSPSAVTEGGEQGFWPSYADMMSAVALILFFLMLLSYISNLITGNDLRNTQEMLSDTQAQVAATQAQVVAAQAEYDKASPPTSTASRTSSSPLPSRSPSRPTPSPSRRS